MTRPDTNDDELDRRPNEERWSIDDVEASREVDRWPANQPRGVEPAGE